MDGEFVVKVLPAAVEQARRLVEEYEDEELVAQIAIVITNAIQMGRDEREAG